MTTKKELEQELEELKIRNQLLENELLELTAHRQVDKPKGVKYCSIPGCQNKMEAKNLCKKHYNFSRRSRSLDTCSIRGCEKYVEAGGLCAMHYQQERRKIHYAKRDAEAAEQNSADGRQKIFTNDSKT